MEFATLRAVALSLATLSSVTLAAAQGPAELPDAADSVVADAMALLPACPDHARVCADAPVALSLAHIPELIAAARTSSDHVMIAAYFATYVGTYEAMAERYAARAAMYRGQPNRRGAADPALHWDRLAANARLAAEEARVAAFIHQRLALLER